MRRTRFLCVLSVLVLAAAGTACGDKASAQTVVRSAASKTENAKTARVAMSVTSEANKTPVNVTADGVLDMPARRGDLTMNMGAALPGSIHVLLFGTTMYMQLPAQLSSQIPGSKPFIKVDLQQLGQQQGINLGALQQNPDATAQLDYLKGVSNDVHEVGKEKVRDTETTHYRGTIDLQKAASTATNADAKASIDHTAQLLGTSTFPVDVWIDGQGRLRKMSYAFDMSKVAAANGSSQAVTGQMNVTMELFDYGVAVKVNEPPADQVTDLSTLLAGAGGKRP